MFFGKPLGFFTQLTSAVLSAIWFGNAIAHHHNAVALFTIIAAVSFSIAAGANYMQQRC